MASTGEGRFSKTELGAVDGFPTVLFPSSHFRAPILQLYCGGNIERHHSWEEKYVLEEGEDGQNQEVWSWHWEFGRALGPWASAVLTAGALMLEGGFYVYT